MIAFIIVGTLLVAGAALSAVLAWRRRWVAGVVTTYGVEHSRGAAFGVWELAAIENNIIGRWPGGMPPRLLRGLRVDWLPVSLDSVSAHWRGLKGVYAPPSRRMGPKGTIFIDVSRGSEAEDVAVYRHELAHAILYLDPATRDIGRSNDAAHAWMDAHGFE